MRFASVVGEGPDGRLVLTSRDGARLAFAEAARTLQAAVEHWEDCAPELEAQAARLERGELADALPARDVKFLAPLPRAWQFLDGSAFLSHAELMTIVFGLSPGDHSRPLMYQGLSDHFLAADDDVPLPSEADGVDFEGEFGVVVDHTPMGTPPEAAMAHIKLVVQLNDWSLRALGPAEMKTGFGFVQAKPASSMAPFAVTPGELGERWREGRVQLPLHVALNNAEFGRPHGGEMAFGFHELVAHAAHTRDLVAGTVIGSGTVSNAAYREIGSSCIAERRGIETVDLGAPVTPYMRFGDRVRMAARLGDWSPFGVIDQQVVRA